jgi:hypothetical protein
MSESVETTVAPVVSIPVADDPTVHPSIKAAHQSLMEKIEKAILDIPHDIAASFDKVEAFIKSKL